MIVFGPIPSRRLGRSLGINNIPHKHCTYSCIYCQLGHTNALTTIRMEYIPPDELFTAVKTRVDELRSAGEKIDYLTFVADGEPTLDIHLGASIKKLKKLGIKIAVITNSSLLMSESVRRDLTFADWVSLKIDSAIPSVWEKINRPHGLLELKNIFEDIMEFVVAYKGELMTETMLVKGVNDSLQSIRATAGAIRMINPRKAFILVPTRPPVESYVAPADWSALAAAYQIFGEHSIEAELLTHDEGNEFTYSSDVEKELMNILSVHPMQKDAVKKFLSRSNTGWEVIEKLIQGDRLKEVVYDRHTFIVRTYFNKPHP